jgi:membrane-associated protein
MDPLTFLADFVINLDQHIGLLILEYGLLVYLVLFLIILLETGLVVTPFLPGDSLIFAAGTFAASGLLNLACLFALLIAAAIIGDTANYWIGHRAGPSVFKEKRRFLRKEYLERAKKFYERHGGKTIFLARFIPIVRTFAPFVAGIGRMRYRRFLSFNVTGAAAWVSLFLLAGYFFGSIPFVQENFSTVIIAIILISLIPLFVEFLRHRRSKK